MWGLCEEVLYQAGFKKQFKGRQTVYPCTLKNKEKAGELFTKKGILTEMYTDESAKLRPGDILNRRKGDGHISIVYSVSGNEVTVYEVTSCKTAFHKYKASMKSVTKKNYVIRIVGKEL